MDVDDLKAPPQNPHRPLEDRPQRPCVMELDRKPENPVRKRGHILQYPVLGTLDIHLDEHTPGTGALEHRRDVYRLVVQTIVDPLPEVRRFLPKNAR